MALQLSVPTLAASLTSAQRKSSKPAYNGQHHQKPISRRLATTAVVSTAFLATQLLSATNTADAFDFRITVPEQTKEEAEAVVKAHARDLVQIKEFIDTKSWREMQFALRASASNLKQDLYTIIQAKPGSQRPDLRKLYSNLFNNVTSLDYAARDKDELQVQEYYNNIVASLDEIFARIL